MRFGILGDAKIARQALRQAILAAGHEITAVGRRDANAGCDPIWGDVSVKTYEGLLADSDVDAVYIALPNHLHVPYAIKALEAGKPVICEKPVALSLDEFGLLDEAVRRTGIYLYDGYMVRYHPQWEWLRELDIGERRQLNAHFSYPPQPEGNIRNKAAWGGGPIWDIGCYCVLSGLMLFDGVPELRSIIKQQDDHLDVEISASAQIVFNHKDRRHQQILNLSCSSGMALSQSLHLIGTDGWARLDVPFNPPEEATARFALQEKGTRKKDGMLGLGQEVTFAPCDHYALMVADFAKAVEEGRQADLTQSYQLTRLLSQMVAA